MNKVIKQFLALCSNDHLSYIQSHLIIINTCFVRSVGRVLSPFYREIGDSVKDPEKVGDRPLISTQELGFFTS